MPLPSGGTYIQFYFGAYRDVFGSGSLDPSAPGDDCYGHTCSYIGSRSLESSAPGDDCDGQRYDSVQYQQKVGGRSYSLLCEYV